MNRLVVVTGSRAFGDDDLAREFIQRRLEKLPTGTVLMHGGAPGVDTWTGQIGEGLGLLVLVREADWLDHTGCHCRNRGTNLRCMFAGNRRNLQMLDEGPEQVLAFWNGWSPGTRHCKDEALRRGIPMELHVLG